MLGRGNPPASLALFFLVFSLFAPMPTFGQCPIITVNPETIPPATIGVQYSQVFTHTGGVPPVIFTATGSLPSGFTLDQGTGELSGISSQRGNFDFTVTVTDADMCTGSRNYRLTVNCGTELFPLSIPFGRLGVPYVQTFSQTGAVGTVTFSLTGTLPAGMTFSSPAATLSGTPGQSGTFPINVTVTDSNSCNRTRKYDLIIASAFGTAPFALVVDPAGNRVFEPGETVSFEPAWLNNSGGVVTLSGFISNWTGPVGATYTIFDGLSNYGTIANGGNVSCATTGNCYSIGTDDPAVRPAAHWDGSLVETLSNGDSKTWTVHLGRTFSDVPASNPFYRFVETLLHRGVTGGCGGTNYCPANPTTRQQMAVFVLVAKEGTGFTPPACTTPMFNDVPASSPFCRWVEELARRGIVAGCGGGNYCPTNPVTRQQMAVFVLASQEGPGFNPPPATGTFADLPATSPFAKWVEELARRGVVAGCGGGNYCPTDPVTRQQMAVFVTQTFGLTIYYP